MNTKIIPRQNIQLSLTFFSLFSPFLFLQKLRLFLVVRHVLNFPDLFCRFFLSLRYFLWNCWFFFWFYLFFLDFLIFWNSFDSVIILLLLWNLQMGPRMGKGASTQHERGHFGSRPCWLSIQCRGQAGYSWFLLTWLWWLQSPSSQGIVYPSL